MAAQLLPLSPLARTLLIEGSSAAALCQLLPPAFFILKTHYLPSAASRSTFRAIRTAGPGPSLRSGVGPSRLGGKDTPCRRQTTKAKHILDSVNVARLAWCSPCRYIAWLQLTTPTVSVYPHAECRGGGAHGGVAACFASSMCAPSIARRLDETAARSSAGPSFPRVHAGVDGGPRTPLSLGRSGARDSTLSGAPLAWF